MNQKFTNYRRIHKIKIIFGILGAILIAGSFLFAYYGFLEVSFGMKTNGEYRNYELCTYSANFNDDERFDSLIYLSNHEYIDPDENITYGNLKDNEIIILDTFQNTLLWKFNLNKSNFIINHLEVLNHEQILSGKMNYNLIFVQYAQVSDQIYDVTYGEGSYRRYANRTGYYETYLLNVSQQYQEIVNISEQITESVYHVQNLYLDFEDDIPDFLIESTNLTNYFDENAEFNGIGNKLSAFFINGTKLWELNSTDEESIIGSFSTHFYGKDYLKGTQINSTHYLLIPNNIGNPKIINLRNTSKSFNLNIEYSGLSAKCILSNTNDFNNDGIIDIALITNDYPEFNQYLHIFDGSDGSILFPSNTIAIEGDQIVNFNLINNFTDPNNNLFLSYSFESKTLRLFNISKENIINNQDCLIKTINFEDFDNEWIEITEKSFYYDNDDIYIKIYSSTNRDSPEFYLISMSTGEIKYSFLYTNQNSQIANIDIKNQAPELIFIESYSEGLQYYTFDSAQRLFMVSNRELILFIISIVMIIGSSIGLLRFRKEFMSLIPQTEIFKKKRKNPDKQLENPQTSNEKTNDVMADSIEGIRKIAMLFLGILIFTAIGFIYFVFFQSSSQINLYNSSDTEVLASGYRIFGIMFSSLAIITTLYNHISPFSAMIFIRIQDWIYKKILHKNREHKIIVLDLSKAKEHSIIAIVQRSLFPLFISLSLGLAVFQALTEQPLTLASGGLNIKWITEFELYGGITFIITYFVLMIIIPGGWLLDDAGVVYYEQPVGIKQPGDISKISDWMLNWLKGLFGITAILNYYELFVNFNFNDVGGNDSVLLNIFTIVVVIGLGVIMAPITYGMATMFYSNTSMLGDLEYNQQILYDKMEKYGIDTRPYNLKSFIEVSNVKNEIEFSNPNKVQKQEEDITLENDSKNSF